MAEIETTKVCRNCATQFTTEIGNTRVFCSGQCNFNYCKRPVMERFWLNVDKSAGPDACWPWLGSLSEKGYGKFTYSGFTVRASRFALEHALGRELREDFFALHTCDNKICCNAAHLYEGTALQNIHDKMERGLQIQKLDEEKVRLIRSLRGKKTQIEIATELGVSIPLICRVQTYQIWTHVV